MSGYRRSLRHLIGSKQGSVMALTVLGMVAFLGMVALAVDLGMLLGSRTESQRAADSGALAGAASLITGPGNEARAKLWAEEYAELNTVHGDPVDLRPDEGSPPDVEVPLAELKVRVRVRNVTANRDNAIPTVFARVLGWNEVDVATLAAAEVVEAGSVGCPFPAALPDRWMDRPNGPNGNDALFNPADGDKYEPHFDLADGVSAVAKAAGDQCDVGSFSTCRATPYHEPYPGPAFTGFVPGANLGAVFELKSKANTNQDPPGPTDPLGWLPGDVEPHAVSPCVNAHAWRCWWDPTGGGGGANELDFWVNGCDGDDGDLPQIDADVGGWIEPENGQTQSVVKEAKKLIDDYGGDGWDWDPAANDGFGCMVKDGDCMDPTTTAFHKRHRGVPIIDPSKTLNNQDDMFIVRWECVFLEKVAKSYHYDGTSVPTPHGYGQSGKWNLYVRFVPGCSGFETGPATGSTVKALRLVE